MPKWKRILILLTLVTVCVPVWLVFRSGEPTYQGRSVSGWLECLYDTRGSAATFWFVPEDSGRVDEISKKRDLLRQSLVAIRHFGTNTLPALLRMTAAQDSSPKNQVNALLNKQRFISFRFRTAKELHEISGMGFRNLGAEAKSATPVLMQLLNHQDSLIRNQVAINLGLIGPAAAAAIPSLVKCLDDPDPNVAVNSLVSLEQICEKQEVVIPFLIHILAKPQSNEIVLRSAISDLGSYGSSSSNAVPIIQSFLTSNSELVQRSATNALKRIDPIAAANLGIE